MLIEKTIAVSEKDYVEAMRRVLRPRKTRLLAVSSLAILTASAWSLIHALAAGILMLIYCVGYLELVNTFFLLPGAYKKSVLHDDEFQVRIDDEGIVMAGRKVSSAVSWDVFKKYDETRNTLLVFHDSNACVILPKRFFTNAEGRNIIAALHRHNVFHRNSVVAGLLK